MRYEEWEKKGGIVPVVITGAAMAGPGNITTRRKKVKRSKKSTRGNMEVGVVDKLKVQRQQGLDERFLGMAQSRGRVHSLDQRSDNL